MNSASWGLRISIHLTSLTTAVLWLVTRSGAGSQFPLNATSALLHYRNIRKYESGVETYDPYLCNWTRNYNAYIKIFLEYLSWNKDPSQYSPTRRSGQRGNRVSSRGLWRGGKRRRRRRGGNIQQRYNDHVDHHDDHHDHHDALMIVLIYRYIRRREGNIQQKYNDHVDDSPPIDHYFCSCLLSWRDTAGKRTFQRLTRWPEYYNCDASSDNHHHHHHHNRHHHQVKWLVPHQMNVLQLATVLKQRLKLPTSKEFFLLIDGRYNCHFSQINPHSLPQKNNIIISLYQLKNII